MRQIELTSAQASWAGLEKREELLTMPKPRTYVDQTPAEQRAVLEVCELREAIEWCHLEAFFAAYHRMFRFERDLTLRFAKAIEYSSQPIPEASLPLVLGWYRETKAQRRTGRKWKGIGTDHDKPAFASMR